MSAERISVSPDSLTPFSRDFINSSGKIAVIGSGSIGGKASGLVHIEKTLLSHFGGYKTHGISLVFPRFVVIASDHFDRFMQINDLYATALSDMSDEYIAHAFSGGRLDPELTDSLREIVDSFAVPLAVRSSSLLEDAMYEPFAGVYATKMLPNNDVDSDARFEKLTAAVKFVYASTFFAPAKGYHRAIGKATEEEKMAVIIQEVVGRRFNDRYYPHISGVARSYNFYPSGAARPENGVVSLALGLGKTIVDGGGVWSYSPSCPKASPPVSSASELLKFSQSEFWAVNMGRPSVTNPMQETEFMVRESITEAEEDGTLKYVASTYRPQDDRVVLGTGAPGPRILTFAPILVAEQLPLNKLLIDLLKVCESSVETNVEIEFAVTIKEGGEARAELGFLQVRPMVVSDFIVDLKAEEMRGEKVLVASENSLGNGVENSISDIIYVDPEKFKSEHTRKIASELAEYNRGMVDLGRPYLLIGFGRWGSSDPWLGIPVNWGQISGARALVEATLPGMDVELSQGAHFFHNMTSFQICYFAVHYNGQYAINWEWLKNQPEERSAEFVRHIRLQSPLSLKVDGRTGRGVILLP